MAHSILCLYTSRCERRRHNARKSSIFPANKFVFISLIFSSPSVSFHTNNNNNNHLRWHSTDINQHRLAASHYPKCHCRLTVRNLLSIPSLKIFTQNFISVRCVFSPSLVVHPSNDDNSCPPLCNSKSRPNHSIPNDSHHTSYPPPNEMKESGKNISN